MDWYQIPRLLKTNYWSEPFFDLGGGNMLMVTYSRPLYDTKGDFMGMLTADVSLNWLKKLVLSNENKKHCYTFMLSRNGYYLVHPNPDKVMNETVFSTVIDVKDSQKRTIGEKMIAGKTDYEIFSKGDTLSYIVFSGIPRTGWSLGTVCAENTLFEELSHASWIMFLLCICSVVIQSVLIFWIVKRMYRKFLSASKPTN
jgi:sigma-B regulation protein RsbU (phosphoserine phosphatase)